MPSQGGSRVACSQRHASQTFAQAISFESSPPRAQAISARTEPAKGTSHNIHLTKPITRFMHILFPFCLLLMPFQIFDDSRLQLVQASHTVPTKPLAFQQRRTAPKAREQQHLVLIGGGHAHVQVIKALESRPPHLKVTLIDAQTSASYSGMVPGCIAGFYTPDQTLLHLQPLAEWANIQFVHDRVIDVDFDRKLVYTEHSQTPIPFDVMSVDIGSTTRDLDLVQGARQYTIPTRPIDKLIARLEEARKVADAPPKLVVIGGGVAGIELSLSITSRWRHDFPTMTCTLLDAGSQLLPNECEAARAKLKLVLADKGIDVKHHCVVREVCEDHVELENGERMPYSQCIWSTGAGAHPLAFHWGSVRGLDTTKQGWIRVQPTLQSTSHPYVFAAGDCVSIENLPNGPTPKAGVYAVRAGPVLVENLTRYLNGEPLIDYKPQDDFLKLLVCGDRKALGCRFGIVVSGEWVWQLKDHIDQSFMKLFDVSLLPKTHLATGKYDTSQYDANEDTEAHRLDPEEAADLLQREVGVDYVVAWRTLRAMARDNDYRDAVLEHVQQSIATHSGVA